MLVGYLRGKKPAAQWSQLDAFRFHNSGCKLMFFLGTEAVNFIQFRKHRTLFLETESKDDHL